MAGNMTNLYIHSGRQEGTIIRQRTDTFCLYRKCEMDSHGRPLALLAFNGESKKRDSLPFRKCLRKGNFLLIDKLSSAVSPVRTNTAGEALNIFGGMEIAASNHLFICISRANITGVVHVSAISSYMAIRIAECECTIMYARM